MEITTRVWRWFSFEVRMALVGASHNSEGTEQQHIDGRVASCGGCAQETAWRTHRSKQSLPQMFREWITYAYQGPDKAGVYLPGDGDRQ